MRRIALLALLVLLVTPFATAQLNPLQSHGAPTGTCVGSQTDVDIDSGNIYTCKLDIWTLNGSTQSFGLKLRRLATTALTSNPLINPPLIVTPAWVANTAYVIGQVVTNGGHQYFCEVGGTSAASGGPAGVGVAPITDNTVTWFYFGDPPITASNALAPAITTNTTRPSGLTTDYSLLANAGLFMISSGHPIAQAGTTFCIAAVSRTSTGNCGNSINFSATYWSASVMTDAPKFVIRTNNATSATFRIIVNGQYLNLSGTVPAAANPSYNMVDYTNAGGRLPRLVTFECEQVCGLAGITVSPADSVWLPPSNDNVRAIFVGDSITLGSNVQVTAMDYPHVVCKLLGWNDCWNVALGATGYIANDAGNGFNFLGSITDVTNYAPNIVIVMGGTNDSGNSATVITAAVLKYLQALRAALPTVPIIVCGIANSQGATATNINAENAILAGFNQFADSNSFFIPIVTDSTLSGPWFTGSGNVTAPSGSGNNDSYGYTASHFTQSGYTYLATKIATYIRTNILPLIP